MTVSRDLDLTVVIPARNAEATLGAQLDALLSQEWEGSWEVVVADNGSTDGTASMVRSYCSSDQRVRLVSASGASGGAHAANAGAMAARGRSLAFCDADDLVGDRWLRTMGTVLRDRPFVTGPLELERLNELWVADSRGQSFASGILLWRGVVPCLRSGNFGLRTDLFRSLGGFDPSYGIGYDIELSMRLWKSGVELHEAPEARVHYRYRGSLNGLWRQSRAYGSANVRLARRLHELGGPRLPRFQGWRSWAWLPRHLPILKDRSGRARWVWVGGSKLGQLQGSVRYRWVSL